MGRNFAGLLVAALFCAGSIILCGATSASALTLKVSVQSVDFDPDGHVRIELVTQGFAQLIGKYPAGITVRPETNEGVAASVEDGFVRWDIKRPGAEMTIPITVTLPGIPDKEFRMKFKGITPEEKSFTKDFIFYTKKGSISAPRSGTNKIGAVAPSPAPAASAPPPVTRFATTASASPDKLVDGGIFNANKMRAQINAAVMVATDPATTESGQAFGLPRSYINLDGSLLRQIGSSRWDMGFAGGMYTSITPISKNPELVASGGKTIYRVGPAIRWHNLNTAVQFDLGVNLSQKFTPLSGNTILSPTLKWDQRLGGNFLLNPVFGLFGYTDVFPKWYAVKNSLRGVLNTGTVVDSWSVQEQIDIPFPIPGLPVPLSLSLGGTWNAIWDPKEKMTGLSNSLDVYPWAGITLGGNTLNVTAPTMLWGADFKDSAKNEAQLSIGGTGTLTLEGDARKIKRIDESGLPAWGEENDEESEGGE